MIYHKIWILRAGLSELVTQGLQEPGKLSQSQESLMADSAAPGSGLRGSDRRSYDRGNNIVWGKHCQISMTSAIVIVPKKVD